MWSEKKVLDIVVPIGLFLFVFLALKMEGFLAFHVLVELFSVVVGVLIGILVYYMHPFNRNDWLHTLGIGFFWVAFLDFFHMLSYHGMSVYHDVLDPNIPTTLWVLARFFELSIVLIAPFTHFKERQAWRIFWALGIVSFGLYVATFQGLLPLMYFEGLTRTKIVMEGFLALMALVGIGIYYHQRRMFHRGMYIMVMLALGLTLVSEIFFCLYVMTDDGFNVLGHFFKLLAYWFLFRGIIVLILQEPFAVMARESNTYHAIPIPVVVVDDQGIIRQVNQSTVTCGAYPYEELIGRNNHLVLHPQHLSPEECPVCHAMKKGIFTTVEVEDHEHVRQYSISPIHNADTTGGYLQFCLDITEQRAAQRQIAHQNTILYHQAYHDSLTDLPNRSALIQALNTRITQEGESIVVVFIDLDRFKEINDTLGHSLGDRLLCAIAQRLGPWLEDGEFLARLGGDEFALLVPHTHQWYGRVEGLLRTFRTPFEVDGEYFEISVSVGMALWPDHGETADILLKHADIAMYQAKAQGRNRACLYTEEMGAQILERLMWEKGLHRALERGEFYLLYQPQLDLATQEMIGVEALVRWAHPTRGSVSPVMFIPLAEEMGIIVELGEWIIRQGCNDMRRWDDQGRWIGSLAINLSARQFESSSLLPMIHEALTLAHISPTRLELEVTESHVMRDSARAIGILSQLRALGVGVAIDDFGTGYSSLAQLKDLPITKLKIDQSFVRDLGHDAKNVAIVRTIIALAEGMHVRTLAEGIETIEQLALLRQYGCHEGQGYLFAKPLESDALMHFTTHS